MTTTLIKNIKCLAGVRENDKLLRGKELAVLPILEDAWLSIEEDRISSYGLMDKDAMPDGDKTIDASGQIVLPCWCDSHTHLVFPASREEEFLDKIKGLNYAEIAARGGGILNSAGKMEDADEEGLYQQAMKRLQSFMQLGTGSIEIKSGYGLSVAAELKMLRVIKRIKETAPIPVKASFLGAHAYPKAFQDNHEGYIKLIIEEMLPVIAAEKLADYVDVFCEKGFFSVEEMNQICTAASQYHLLPKLHVNQLNSIGGIQAAIDLQAVSVDHLEVMTNEDTLALASSDTIGTLLPTAAFFLRQALQPARQLIDAGAAIALATDFNPGSSPSGNMNFVVALACIQMRMLPEEAINAATINGAYAMGVEKDTGSISVGKKANLIFTKPVPSLTYLPYSFGENNIDKVMINGQWLT